MGDYYLVPVLSNNGKMHILTNGKMSIGDASTTVMTSSNALLVNGNMTAYGAYSTNAVTAMQIPYGNTASRPSSNLSPGYIRYNTDINLIEYYKSSSSIWLPLYSPPQLKSLTTSNTPNNLIFQDVSYNQYVYLTGINFDSSLNIVRFLGADGSNNFFSPSVVWNSYTSITAQVPSSAFTGSFVNGASPYSVNVSSSLSGMSSTLSSSLYVGFDPIFVTAQYPSTYATYYNGQTYTAGSAGSSGAGIAVYLEAYDPCGNSVTFSVDPSNNSSYSSPNSPGGTWSLSSTTYNAGTGHYYAYITGTVGNSTATTGNTSPNYSFGVIITNSKGSSTKGLFKMVINPYYMIASVAATGGTGATVTPNQLTATSKTYSMMTSTNTTTTTYSLTITALGCPGTTSTPANNNALDFLLVGGGGGGGNGYQGGGGGAGGLVSSNATYGACGGGGSAVGAYTITQIGTYTIQVGGGGAGAVYNSSTSTIPVCGSNTYIQTPLSSTIYTAYGGGLGTGEQNYSVPAYNYVCLNGGCGGGGAHSGSYYTAPFYGYGSALTGTIPPGYVNPGGFIDGSNPAYQAITPTQGYNGGAGLCGGGSSYTGPFVGGGGGGAGAAGQAAQSNGAPGNGGNGLANSITGSSVTYAGGGGGATRSTGTAGGTGGTGGGGNGNSSATTGITAGSGTNGLGGGGGAVGLGGGAGSSSSTGYAGAGGNGICILRFGASATIT